MKRVVLVLMFLASADLAVAQARMSTTNRACTASQQDVARGGAVVLGTGGYTYDRFVRDRSFCEVAEFTEPAWVPSADSQACFVGYRCKEADSLHD